MKRAALYVRVSTQEQKKHGLSVDSQIVALQKYCEDNGMLVSGIYNDAGISARKPYSKRPALIQLLDDCERGNIDVILITRLDRWFRSVSGYHEVQSRLDACHVPWKTIWEDYNTETSDGVFKVNIMLSIAQAEADRTSEKIKSVNEYRRDKGFYVGSAPTGYLIRDKHLVKDPEMQEAVQAFFDAYLKTYSSSEAMKAYTEISGKKVNYRQARAMLRNGTYSGNAYGSECEGYITPEQHEEIVSVMQSRIRAPKDPDKIYLFSGLCKCSICGGGCAAKTKRYTYTCKSGEVRHHEIKHYRCAKHVSKYDCPGTQMAETKLENYLLKSLDRVIENYNISVMEQKGKSHTKEIEELRKRLARVGDRYEDGDITREEYRIKRDSIQKEIRELEQKDKIITSQKTVSLPDDWKAIYQDLSMANKQIFWKKVIEKIILYRNKEPEIVFR